MSFEHLIIDETSAIFPIYENKEQLNFKRRILKSCTENYQLEDDREYTTA